MPTRAYAAFEATRPLSEFSITRREPTTTDVAIDILYCGVCHSDLHQCRDEWQPMAPTIYPCVPGHEIVGRVTAVGSEVKKFRVGDLAAVGVLVDSCRACTSCQRGLEQYCLNGPTFTYNAPDQHLPDAVTYGGYAENIVVDEAFTLHVPAKLDLAAVAPLLCAGITTYSPLRNWKVGPGQTVGIVGLGGLGHMAVKFAHALGARVVLFTTSPSKVEDGQRLGAHEVIVTHDLEVFAQNAGRFDFILDCVSAPHDLNLYLQLLKLDGTLCLVGLPEKPFSLAPFSMVLPRKQLAGSAIGGLPETQEMLDFCAHHNIVSDVEVIPIQKINEAFDRLVKGDVKYRFVIDMASLKG